MSKKAVEVQGLAKYYGKQCCIENVNFTIEKGEIFGFIGPNGAGKTTTIRTLLALIHPTSGSASIFGKDCIKEAEAVAGDLGYLPTEIYYYENMTALTFYVFLACAINGMNMGQKMITKEYMQKTADFIFTKPHSRGKVFISKIIAILTSALIIGLIYFLASWAGMVIGAGDNYDFLIMTQIAFSIVFVQLIFAALGLFVGIIFPYIRAPLLVATAVAFVSYVTGSFSNKMGYTALTYLSPYHYFTSAEIIKTGSYDIGFLVLSFFLVSGLLGISYHVFRKKDIIIVS